jgi:hypothetical protein
MTQNLSDCKHPFQFVTEEMRQACGLLPWLFWKKRPWLRQICWRRIESLIPKQMGWLPMPHFAPYYHNKSNYPIQQWCL